nr:MAG TPA: Head Tail Connector Protein [Bacteriophage sp.]
MYVDYSYYKAAYGGDLPSEAFKQKEIQASSIVDFYTFSRIKTADERVKNCVCELVDLLHNQESKEIKSESVSKYKIEYTEDVSLSKEEKQREIVRKWLLHTGLMYRGVSKC